MSDPLIQFVVTSIICFAFGFALGMCLGWLLKLLRTEREQVKAEAVSQGGRRQPTPNGWPS